MRLSTTTAILLAFTMMARLTAQTTSSTQLDAAARSAVVDSLAHELRRIYVRPSVADSLAVALIRRDHAGAFSEATTIERFADRLNQEIRSLIHDDAHLAVRLEPARTAASAAENQRQSFLDFVRDAHDENFGIQDVRLLDGNVGYIRFGEFLYQLTMSGQPFSSTAIIAAMQLVAHRDALILDLRDNRGGHTSTVPLIMSYFFDQATLLGASRGRDEPDAMQAWTQEYVPLPRFGGRKPLYVLTGDSTFSAGEGIAAGLQSTKRATIVGARTRGGANSGDFHSIGAGLRVFIPERLNFGVHGESIESVGVAPDVAVPADHAFDVAYAMALESLARAEPNAERKRALEALATRVKQGRVSPRAPAS